MAVEHAAALPGSHDDGGKLVLRLVLGVLVLFHGVAKIIGGPAFVVGLVTKAGLPGAFGYAVYLGEVLGPILIILGIWTRLGALLIAINMLFAVGLVRMPQLFTIAPTGGYGLELEAMYLFGAVAVALLGAGRYSLGGIDGRFN
jgi:putative oxidoreductase